MTWLSTRGSSDVHATIKTTLLWLLENALPRIPVCVHRGAAGAILMAGELESNRYVIGRFFGNDPFDTEQLGSVPAWRLPALLDSWRLRIDIVCATVDRISARRFPRSGYLRAPTWIRMIAPVPERGGWERGCRAWRNEQLVRKHELTWRNSHSPEDLDTFIERDYLPYMRARFGAQAYIRPERWFRTRFRDGGLIWINQGEQPVAGVLYDLCGRSLRYLAVACARGDVALLRIGAISATFLACFELARRNRCQAVDLRNSRPCIDDGLLQAKRVWGGAIAPPDDGTREIVVGWHVSTPAVMRFCTRVPLIVRDSNVFAALHGPAEAGAPMTVPGGIRRLITPVAGGQFGEWIGRDPCQ